MTAETLLGQGISANSLIDKGVALFDQGKYKDAIVFYQQALAIDSKSDRANYEIGYAYNELKDYQQAVNYSDKIIQANGAHLEEAYTLKASALDMLGKHDLAIQTYQEGIKRYPKDYLLNYNVGLTFYEENKYDIAAYYAGKALEVKPKHASSHLILANSMYGAGKKSQSLMASYYFLLLEPDSKRSLSALALLEKQLKAGVSKDSGDVTTIHFSGHETENEFGPADAILPFQQALRNSDKNKNKSDEQFFFETTELFFKVLSELSDKNTNHNIWWDVYVPFYKDLVKSKNTEAFCYYISKSKNSSAVNNWLSSHQSEVNRLIQWYKTK